MLCLGSLWHSVQDAMGEHISPNSDFHICAVPSVIKYIDRKQAALPVRHLALDADSSCLFC